VNTLFVERTVETPAEAARILEDARQVLHLRDLGGVRVLHRYAVEGVSEAVLDQASRVVFADPATDRVSQNVELAEDERAFAYAYLPGQFDTRAQAAVDALHVLGAEEPRVLVASVVIVRGLATGLERLKRYLINPVDSEEVDPFDAQGQLQELRRAEGAPRHESEQSPGSPVGAAPDTIPITHLSSASQAASEAAAIRDHLSLAMTGEDLYFCADAFRQEGREPRLIELRILDTYWSDHCRHQTFTTTLTDIRVPADSPEERALKHYRKLRREVNGDTRPETLMDLATIVAKAMRAGGELGDVDESEEVNAAGVVVGGATPEEGEWLLLFKNETHNHPTEIEPYGGASTCLGGAIRDPMSGRGTVFQALRVSGSGDPRQELQETRAGKLPQRVIALESARGFSAYGNQFGLATGVVGEHYHPGYVAKRLEAGAVLGAVPRRFLRRERPSPGDVVVLLGGRTGRDGIGGATGSSKEHTEESVAIAGAEVQKGNPPVERALYRLYRDPRFLSMIKRCNDFGAGGVAVAVGELADGIDIDLSAVPKKYAYLAPDEIAISESQERMAVVVQDSDVNAIRRLAAEENLEATPIARITGGERLVMRYRGETVVDLPRALLDSAGAPKATAVEIAPPATPAAAPAPPATWLDAIGALRGGTTPGLTSRFDSTIGRGTVLLPLGGRYQRSPAAATVMRLPAATKSGAANAAPAPRARPVSIASYGFAPGIAATSPYHGGYLAVVEAVCKAVAAGADATRIRLSLQEYFPRPGSDPERWGLPVGALLGAMEAQADLRTPAIGGKDSMSGTFEDLDVPPTLIAFAFTTGTEDRVRSPELKEEGNTLVLLSPAESTGRPDGAALRELLRFVHGCTNDPGLRSVIPCGEAGVAPALTEAAFGNGLGLRLTVAGADGAPETEAPGTQEIAWFTPAIGSLILEVTPAFFRDVVLPWSRSGAARGVNARELGVTHGAEIATTSWSLPVAEAWRAWASVLEDVYRSGDVDGATGAAAHPGVGERSVADGGDTPTQSARPAIPRPRVVIPVFPGTNCEYDTAEAVDAAGGRSETIVLKTLSTTAIAESLGHLAGALAESQILILPGGFSAGDEPDGSGKFMAALLRQPRVADAIAGLLGRDGLILGICNGFQALVRLGLVPYGEFRNRAPGDPVLARNRIGHHVSRMAWVRVASNASPWLAATEPGGVYGLPVSHGEGRFLIDPERAQALLDAGQVATQYVTPAGEIAEGEPWNPNGSVLAIEGITSPDGRILGRMGHSERVAPGLFRNHPDPGDAKIIESGVRAFR
jgi:phosphoribosylformylglycinamidine synthase